MKVIFNIALREAMNPMHSRLSLLCVVALGVFPATASANERHFAWTYETGVLPAGTAELEPWTTWRVGRESYFSRFDHRIEFEYGITDRLQTALYLNFRGVASREGNGEIETSFDYQGISYYAAPKQKTKPKDLSEVDPEQVGELLATFERRAQPLLALLQPPRLADLKS